MDSEVGRRYFVTEALEAVFENGVFRPFNAQASQSERVHLTVERVGHASGDDVLRLTRVYAALSSSDIDGIERMARRSITAGQSRT
jgi:hypothetical protein